MLRLVVLVEHSGPRCGNPMRWPRLESETVCPWLQQKPWRGRAKVPRDITLRLQCTLFKQWFPPGDTNRSPRRLRVCQQSDVSRHGTIEELEDLRVDATDNRKTLDGPDTTVALVREWVGSLERELNNALL